MLANKPPPNPPGVPPERPDAQKPEKRILARTQHILTADVQFLGSQVPTSASDWYKWNNLDEYEYDMNSLDKWKNIPWLNKKDILTVITDVNVSDSSIYNNIRGTMVDPADANLIHNLFCEGVGEFKIQGWYDAQKRWVPEVDPDGDGSLTDSDFFTSGGVIDPINVPGVLYPYRAWLPISPYVQIISIIPPYPDQLIDEAHFNDIPGLGRALKFTFTLYDSKGVIKNGRTFTHIVYLGE
jgi:hypothetical protein